MYLVSRVAGSDADLDDFLPPHPTQKNQEDRGQHALAAYLKSYVKP